MRIGDTIVAHASPSGASARAIVRVSGPEAPTVASWAGVNRWERGTAMAALPIGGPAALRVIAICLPAPASYTSEDSLEILMPGAPHLVQRVLDRILAIAGVRLASPGEFTARAHLHGRLTLEQAEGVAMFIRARNEAEGQAARRLLSGEQGDAYVAFAESLAVALALVEAGIDFTDQEDVVAITPALLAERLRDVESRVGEALRGAGRAATGETAVVVCLAGPPNAGKSTLFNALLGRRRAVTDAQAGSTRDVLRETISLDDQATGLQVTLEDIAGLDAAFSAHSEVDAAAQRAAQRAVENADIIVHCDPSGRFPRILQQGDKPTIRVRTKADLPSDDASQRDGALGVCALDGWHVGALRRAIADSALGADVSRTGADLSVLPRHSSAMQRAHVALEDAVRRSDADARHGRLHDPEIVAGLLREALDALGEISGHIAPDDVIGRVFAHFCVGK